MKRLLRRDVVVAVIAASLILLGGCFYAVAERTSILASIYWAITEATTAGGSYSPATHAGRLVNVLLLLTAAPALAYFFSVITAQHTAKRVHEKNKTHMAEMEDRLKKHITKAVGENNAVQK